MSTKRFVTSALRWGQSRKHQGPGVTVEVDSSKEPYRQPNLSGK